MSYFPGPFQLKDKLGNNPDISGFGQLIVGERLDQILVKFSYNNSSYDVTATTSGTGTTSNASSMGIVASGTGVGIGSLTSVRTMIYRPGHEIHIFVSAVFSTGQDANSYQRIGIYDDVSGYWIGYSGTSFGISKRDASTDSFVASTSFNLDKLDGTGTSGFTLDPTKLNLYKIHYDGSGPVAFAVYSSHPGGWITFHSINILNTSSVVALSSASNNIQMEAGRSTGTGTSVSVSSAEWAAGTTEGVHTYAGHRVFAGKSSKTLTAGVETYIASFQNKTTYASKNNKIPSSAVFFGASVDGTKNTVFNFYRNATLTTPTWVDVDTTNSITAIDTTAAAFSGGTTELFVPMAKVDQIVFDIGVGHIHMELFPGETMTITGTSAAASDVVIAFRWEEYFS